MLLNVGSLFTNITLETLLFVNMKGSGQSYRLKIYWSTYKNQRMLRKMEILVFTKTNDNYSGTSQKEIPPGDMRLSIMTFWLFYFPMQHKKLASSYL